MLPLSVWRGYASLDDWLSVTGTTLWLVEDDGVEAVGTGLGHWVVDLDTDAVGFMEALDFSHTTDIMTQWIDDLAATRDTVEQQENLAHQMQLHRDRVLAAQGPQFFAAVRNSAQALTDELNEKLSVSLGKVECKTLLETQFRIVKAEKFPHVTLTIEYDAKRHQIRVHRVIKKRPMDDGSVADEVCELSIDADDRLIAQSRTDHPMAEPALLASDILQTTLVGLFEV